MFKKTDFFQARKDIHIALMKDNFLKLKERLFPYKISVQSLFDEIIEQIVTDAKWSTRLIEDLHNKNVQRELDLIEARNARLAEDKMNVNEPFSVIDQKTVYQLISNALEKEGKK